MTHTVKGCCPVDCPDSCCWVAHVSNGRVERVVGAKEHPFTRGGLCAKVRDYQERTDAPDRILSPLRRNGAKGSGQFEQISWHEAIDTIALRFAGIIERHGPQALMPLHYLGSMGVVQRLALMRVFNALGATEIHGSICGAPGAALEAQGHPIGFDPEELVDARLVVLWGSNLLSTGHHQWHFMKEARRLHGARIICIDPRRTLTAQQCDQYICIRPGTDAILAAGIAHVMLSENLADVEFTQQVSRDFDSFREMVGEWTPERVASACNIPSTVVVELAREFAQAQPAAIRCGVGVQQTVQGDALVRNLSALAILGGHWRTRGGGLLIETAPVMNDDAPACPELNTSERRSLDLAALGSHLTDETLNPPIKGLMVWNMNPAVVLPNAAQVWRGLGRDDLFTVVLEHFMTDTARFADIVLPSTTQLEHFDVQGAWGHHYISVNNPAIAPLGEAKSHGEVMRLLAQRLELTQSVLQASDEDIAASALPQDTGFAELKAQGWKKSSPPRPNLNTGDQKLSLMGELVEPPAQDSQRKLQLQLQLLTPKAHYFLNSSFANMERQRRAQIAPRLEMSSADATSLGLSDGQQVVIKNDLGEIFATLHVTDTVSTGVVALPGKWWSRPKKTGALANLLTSSLWSPSGQPAYNDTFVDVEGVT